eukprot:scaffold1.g5704.t1
MAPATWTRATLRVPASNSIPWTWLRTWTTFAACSSRRMPQTACSLWAECQAGRTGAGAEQLCAPLVLVQTACNESPALPEYLVLCAPQSLVPACKTAGRVTALRSATQLYQDVQAACREAPAPAPCARCAAQPLSGDDRVAVAQAVQTTCPDPLGTLSAICLERDGTGCANWAALCAAASNGSALPALCLGAPAPAPAAAAAPSAKAGAAGAGGAGSAASPSGAASGTDAALGAGCAGDPTAPECAGGARQAAGVESDMPVMMKMWLHASMSDIILLKNWVPTNAGAYIASCLAVIATAVVAQALKAYRLVLEADWAAQRAAAAAAARAGSLGQGNGGASGRASIDGGPSAPLMGKRRLSLLLLPAAGGGAAGRNAARAAFVIAVRVCPAASAACASLWASLGACCTRGDCMASHARLTPQPSATLPSHAWQTSFLEYCLMLIVMTFNIGLLVSAVLGFGIGALLFGHLGERQGTALGGAEPGPDMEASLRVPLGCCDSTRI